MGDDNEGVQHLKNILHSSFKMKDLGLLIYFLGLDVPSTLSELANLTDDKQVDISLELNVKYFTSEGQVLHDVTMCCLVGRLYQTRTRPDIAYAVEIVSQFFSAPCQRHLTAVHCII